MLFSYEGILFLNLIVECITIFISSFSSITLWLTVVSHYKYNTFALELECVYTIGHVELDRWYRWNLDNQIDQICPQKKVFALLFKTWSFLLSDWRHKVWEWPTCSRDAAWDFTPGTALFRHFLDSDPRLNSREKRHREGVKKSMIR